MSTGIHRVRSHMRDGHRVRAHYRASTGETSNPGETLASFKARIGRGSSSGPEASRPAARSPRGLTNGRGRQSRVPQNRVRRGGDSVKSAPPKRILSGLRSAAKYSGTPKQRAAAENAAFDVMDELNGWSDKALMDKFSDDQLEDLIDVADQLGHVVLRDRLDEWFNEPAPKPARPRVTPHGQHSGVFKPSGNAKRNVTAMSDAKLAAIAGAKPKNADQRELVKKVKAEIRSRGGGRRPR